MQMEQALERLGYAGFRKGQREAIEELMNGRRLLLVAPTGGGKSLCYQLPALLLPGTTLVVSPLIALMHDQVEGLARRGIKATFFASTLDSATMRERMSKLRQGAYQIVYAAPERLVLDGFRQLLREANVPLIAIDEAHCISEWGHDFRPEYLKIGELIEAMPDARVLACTATATPVVRDEILSRLGLSADTPQLVQGFARPNLAMSVQDVPGAKGRQQAVNELLADALGSPAAPKGTAIVYAPTRKATEEEAIRLTKCGWRAGAYHAGLQGQERERVQDAFIAGKLDVAVATNAFGMGIDRGDVRAVAHLAPPGSIEAYYQEVGRAGRDGEPAFGLMLVCPSDMPLRRSLLTRPGPDGMTAPAAVIEHKWNLFLELMRWSEGGTCRHDAILRYFGDDHETLHGCGRCDVCAHLAGEGEAHDPTHVALTVRKALSGVARIHGRFGLTAAVQLLRGAQDPRLDRAGLTRVSTFGILKERPEAWLLSLLRRCVTAGWVDFVGQDRPVAILTERGAAVMKATAPARIILPQVAVQASPRRSRQAAFASGSRGHARAGASAHAVGPGGTQVAVEVVELDEMGAVVFEALRQTRLALSKEAKVPPYVVASDRTLRDLATLRPRNLDELKLAHGIGPAKADKFGPALLQAISQGQSENP
jgi:ATP-dependent DNA helicase RecQ